MRQPKIIYKLLTALLLIVLVPMTLLAQGVSVSLSVDPFPTQYISEWEVDPNMVQFSIRNDSTETVTAKALVTIRKNGTSVIASGETYYVDIEVGTDQVLYTPDIINQQSIDYDKSIEEIALRTGRLPEGSYALCLILESDNGDVLADEVCAYFEILYPDPPYLVYPFDSDSIQEQQPVFQWQPVQTPVNFQISYKLKITEVQQHQTPLEALNQTGFNQFNEENIIETNFTYPVSALTFESGKKYAWQVSVVDQNGYAPSANEGKSEIWTFVYTDTDEPGQESTSAYTLDLVPSGSESSSDNSIGNITTMSFEELEAEWERIKAGGEVVFPIPDLGLFDRFRLSSVGVSFDHKNKVVAFRGTTERYNEKNAQVLLTITFDKGVKCAISIKLPHFSFGGVFLEFASHAKYKELATDFAIISFTNKKHTLSSKTLPSGVADFFDTNSVALEPGMNFYSVIDIDRTPWFEKVVNFIGVESNQVVMTGYGGPVKNLLTKKEAQDFELSLAAKLPAIISPEFRLWLKSRQFEVKGGIKRALGKADTTSTKPDTSSSTSEPVGGPGYSVDTTKPKLEAQYSPFIELKETLKGSFGNRKEHSFYRLVNLEFNPDTNDIDVKVQYGTDDTISLGLPWLGIHDSKLTFEFSKEEAKVNLMGGFAILDMKVADTVFVEIGQKIIPKKDSTKSDSTKIETPKTDTTKPKVSDSTSSKNKLNFRAKAKLNDDFSMSKLMQLILKTASDKTSIPTVSIPGDLFSLTNKAVGFTGGDNSEFYVTAESFLMNSHTNLFLSLAKNEKNERQFTIGVKPESWKLTEAIPLLSNPVLDNLDFSRLGFVITNQDCRISSEDLGLDTREFYSKMYAADQYELVLKPGINLISVIPLENMEPDDPLIKLMDHLGMHSKGLLLQGSFGNVFGLMTGKSGGSLDLIKDIYLKAGLPPMQPPGSPEWFKSGELALEITGAPSVGMIGAITVDINGDIITFFVQGKIARDGPGVALAIVGGMEAEEPWVAPFGIKFLTLNKTVVKISVNAYGNIGLGFAGDLVIGEKDIQCAVAVAINAYTGVPSNAMFDGSSEEGVGFADLAKLQSKMVTAASGVTAAPLPVVALPEMVIKDMGLKFAPKSDPDLGVEAGMAIKGALHLSRTPGGEMENFAAVDCNVGVEGIWAKGHLNEFKVGPLVWNDAMIDLQLIPFQSHFLLNGEVEILGSMKMIDLAITRDSLDFKTETEIDGLYRSQLTASGAFNLTKPNFAVHGELENDFGEFLEKPLGEGLSLSAKAGILSLEGALIAFEKSEKLQAEKEKAVEQLKQELDKLREPAKNVMLAAKADRDAALAEVNTAKRNKNNAFNNFKKIPKRKIKEKAAALRTFNSRLSVYRKKITAYTKLNAVYVTKLGIYNAIPDPDNNPVMVALKNEAAKLWTELMNQKASIEKLQQFFQAIINYVDTYGKSPVKILSSEFDSSLKNLVQGEGVDFHIELELLDEYKELDIKMSFDNIGAAVKEIVEKLMKS